MIVFIYRILLICFLFSLISDGFFWNRSPPLNINRVSVPYDNQSCVSDKHSQFPIEFLSPDIHWQDEYTLISQYFPHKTEQEKTMNPLRWYAFDQRNNKRKLIGLIYAYGKGLPKGDQIRYRQRSLLVKNNSCFDSLSDRYRSRSSSLNSMQQSIRQRIARIRTINPRFIHLSLIVVDRAYHQMNIGTRLLERIETYCQDFECQYIELVPIPDRKIKEFYKKKGYFEEIGTNRRGFWIKYFKRKARPRSDHYPYRPCPST
jgi:GNAT superfamily N-acetyltransferase